MQQKQPKEKVDKKAAPAKKQNDESEKHNNQVKNENRTFANRLIKQSCKADDFEDSEESFDGSWSDQSVVDSQNNEPKIKGELVVLNVDLGLRGHQVITGLSS